MPSGCLLELIVSLRDRMAVRAQLVHNIGCACSACMPTMTADAMLIRSALTNNTCKNKLNRGRARLRRMPLSMAGIGMNLRLTSCIY